MASALLVAAETPPGPTPFPTDPAKWPGSGPTRSFDWTPKYRAKFWAERDRKQGAVVLVGDSLTQGWRTVEQDFLSLKIADRGIGGDVSRGVLFRLKEDVLDLHPRSVVILIGINDLTAGAMGETIAGNIRAMIGEIRSATSAPIILCTIPSSRNATAPVDDQQRVLTNVAILRMESVNDRVYSLDLSRLLNNPDGSFQPRFHGPDGFHLGPEGYRIWKRGLEGVLVRAGVIQ